MQSNGIEGTEKVVLPLRRIKVKSIEHLKKPTRSFFILYKAICYDNFCIIIFVMSEFCFERFLRLMVSNDF